MAPSVEQIGQGGLLGGGETGGVGRYAPVLCKLQLVRFGAGAMLALLGLLRMAYKMF